MTITLILVIVSLIIILEGLFVAVFTNSTKKMLIDISKNVKKLRKFGIIELIIGIIILAIALLLRNY